MNIFNKYVNHRKNLAKILKSWSFFDLIHTKTKLAFLKINLSSFDQEYFYFCH